MNGRLFQSGIYSPCKINEDWKRSLSNSVLRISTFSNVICNCMIQFILYSMATMAFCLGVFVCSYCSILFNSYCIIIHGIIFQCLVLRY